MTVSEIPNCNVWMCNCRYSMSDFVGTGKKVMKEKLSAVFLQKSVYFVDWKKCK